MEQTSSPSASASAQLVDSQMHDDQSTENPSESKSSGRPSIEPESRANSSNSDLETASLNRSPSVSISTSTGMIQNLLGVLEECSTSASSTSIATSVAAETIRKDSPEDTESISTQESSSTTTREQHAPTGGPVSQHSQSFMDIPQGNRSASSNHAAQSCLDRGLESLEQISSIVYLKDTPNTLNRTQTILAHNRVALGAIYTILTCDCSKDGYLIVIVSLIMCKVLDMYIAAVQPTPNAQEGPESVLHSQSATNDSSSMGQTTATRSSNPVEGGYSAQMAAQRVLGELHLVRGPIEELLSALQKQAAHIEQRIETGGPETFSLDMLNEQTLPFSASVYDSLALDLAKHLRKLSLDVTSRVRAA